MANALEHASERELAALDRLLGADGKSHWDAFYADRARPCPFFVTAPDESLAEWVEAGLLRPGRAVDIGCGAARNAIFLARHGFAVEGVDGSRTAIEWAAERVAEAGVHVSLSCRDVFAQKPAAGTLDLVCDSGCFHHIPPHRRGAYVALVVDALKPGGWLSLVCFRPEGGSGYTDAEVYKRRSMGGGLGFTEARLRDIWSPALHIVLVRQMNKPPQGSDRFGENFLWAVLAQKPATP